MIAAPLSDPPRLLSRRDIPCWFREPFSCRPRGSRRRSGLTLIELLVGVTLSLLLIFAVVQVFDWLGTTLTNERAMIELSGQLRAAAQRLQDDLDHVTCRPLNPWTDSAHAKGYFQYHEGAASDAYFADATKRLVSTAEGDQLVATGDADDLLAFTVYSDIPFVGHVLDPTTGAPVQIESTRAEVVWWVATVDVDGDGNALNSEPRVLLRRQFLVRPDLTNVSDTLGVAGVDAYRLQSELSLFVDVSGVVRLNDLGTLTWPVNRSVNCPNSSLLFPRLLRPPGTADNGVPALQQYGRFVVLSDLLAFDVRAYDPEAPIVVLNDSKDEFAVTPGDLGYPFDATEMTQAVDTNNTSRVVGVGAYVDLNYLHDNSVSITSGNRVSRFSGGPDYRQSGGTSYFSNLMDGVLTSNAPPVAIYTTWPLDFERDGIDQNGNSQRDEAFNGVDDLDQVQNKRINGVDDMGERETMPPYPHALRGIEVRLRMEDFSTRQVRQASVVGDFQTD